MDKLKQIIINKQKYYTADEILALELPFLKTCKNGRRIIKKKKLTKNDYIYAKIKNNEWIKSDGNSYKFDKVLINKKWLDEKYVDEEDIEESHEDNDEESHEDNNDDEITIVPDIIELKKSEKMKDNKGNILEIEIRGTRKHNNCFFLVNDVAKGFGMNNLGHTLIHKNSGYQKNIHYRYFLNIKVKKLFLTYVGLLKVLFTSRNKTVNNFMGWATETLFIAHLATKTQKDRLASKLMGISADVIKEVFNKTSSTLPTLYLSSIGKVKDLRVTLNIGEEYDDDMIVCKGGETNDLTRRMDELNETFGKMPGANLCLKWYNYIDPQYTSKAETELLQVMAKMNYKFTHPKYEELIIFSKKDIKIIIDQYTNISMKYIGHMRELTDKIKNLENHIAHMKKDTEIIKKDNEIMKKDLENQTAILKKDNEIDLMKKNTEINKLKMENKLLKKDLEINNLKRQIKNNNR
jgi:hypothetical protein